MIPIITDKNSINRSSYMFRVCRFKTVQEWQIDHSLAHYKEGKITTGRGASKNDAIHKAPPEAD